ncbi:MAG: dihydroneopterin aldolase [Proteobacteria bacterium]|nr:dihydroneopterin aldolase [Pseudomonadota bacterium]
MKALTPTLRRLFLRDHEVLARIGVHDFERAAPQRLRVNVDLWVSAMPAPGDDLAEVVDYDFVRAAIATRLAQGHINLQETLADDVADAILAHPQVRAVRVQTDKPDVYPDCAAVGVETYREKP